MVMSFMIFEHLVTKSEFFFALWEENEKTTEGPVVECLGFARVCASRELQACFLF